MTEWLEGVPLVRAVIAKVRANGFKKVFGSKRVPRELKPVPVPMDVLERVRLDGDVPLSPCLKEWLAFDCGYFGWLDADGQLQREKLGELGRRRFGRVGKMFESLEKTSFPRDVYEVPAAATKSIKVTAFVYPSPVDSTGEFPVIDAHFVGLEPPEVTVHFPGIDHYLGGTAGMFDEPVVGARTAHPRLLEHQRHVLGGRDHLTLEGDEQGSSEGIDGGLPAGVTEGSRGRFMQVGNHPVPKGFRVISEMAHPFSGEMVRQLKRDR